MRTVRDEQTVSETREQLLTAANRVFLREGYEDVSMKMLSDEANCTTGKFYSNNLGKPELLTFLGDRYCERNAEFSAPLLEKWNDRKLSGKEEEQLHFLYEMLTALEVCRLNPMAAELFETALTDAEIRPAVLKNIRKKLGTTIVEEQNVRYLAFILFGGIETVKAEPEAEYKAVAKPFLKNLMGNLSLSPERETEALGIMLRQKTAVHEQAYRMLVAMLKM